MGSIADNIFIATGSYDKAKEKYTLELTGEELCIIYNWMQCADDSGDSPFMTEDNVTRTLVNRLNHMLNWYNNPNITDKERLERKYIIANRKNAELEYKLEQINKLIKGLKEDK